MRDHLETNFSLQPIFLSQVSEVKVALTFLARRDLLGLLIEGSPIGKSRKLVKFPFSENWKDMSSDSVGGLGSFKGFRFADLLKLGEC
ncbi:hypothetical protein TNCT_315801 [Trichonephila clavata]|uniref:Uncharacterized protein n=1 Tax=Trichonephila clavata TaxID=2740835 RepID=A0A8X6FTL9_TRICU|nr:hypothetical protein TNCT_315801 [Trichonephila clavata]